MVKKKSPVVILTVIGVALAGAVIMNAREHAPALPQRPDAPAPTQETSQAKPLETKAAIFGTGKAPAGKNSAPPGGAPPMQQTPPSTTASPKLPVPGPSDASGQWYSPEAHR